MPPKKGKKKEHDGPPPGVISDSRFSMSQSAPTFKRMKPEAHRTKLDMRFKAVLEDDRFRVPGSEMDKYGRKSKKGKSASDELSAFYTLDDGEDEVGGRVGARARQRYGRQWYECWRASGAAALAMATMTSDSNDSSGDLHGVSGVSGITGIPDIGISDMKPV